MTNVIRIEKKFNRLVFGGATNRVLRVERPQVRILTRGIQGPAGRDGVDGGGLAALVDDMSPQLGGDLEMNGHQILGLFESDECVIDGGLIG